MTCFSISVAVVYYSSLSTVVYSLYVYTYIVVYSLYYMFIVEDQHVEAYSDALCFFSGMSYGSIIGVSSVL